MKTKILTAVFFALTVGCNLDQGMEGISETPSGTVVAGLRSFENCSDLTEFLVGREDEGGGSAPPLGEPTVGMPMIPVESGTEDAAPAAPGDDDDEAMASAPEATTVEEADLVKRDGDRLYVANASSGLLIYDVSAPADMRRIGRFAIPGFRPLEMQISGNKLILISNAAAGKTKILAVDVSDPASISIVKSWEFVGSYQESRQVGSAVYLVLQKWVGGPKRTLEAQLREKTPCDRVYVPEELEGEGPTSFISWNVIGLSLADLGADPGREPVEVSIIGSFVSAVYATPEHFYLANNVFEEDRTGIYLLSLNPETAGVTPAAKASVPGSIVNQFFMDETDGVFRIASTTRAQNTGTADDVKNYLTTFRVREKGLLPLGQIDSIMPGERMTAARFLGSRAFVTTAVAFQDPLVSVDLADPASPQIKATIDLPGWPDYIHVWNGLLMTVGLGNGWASGLTLNLFDVADADHPHLVEQETIPDSFSSEAQYDHRAFAFFEDRGTLAIPVAGNSGSRIVLYRVQKEGFTAVGSIVHDDLFKGMETEDYFPIFLRRAVEIGDAIVTVSDGGIQANGFDDLDIELFGEIFPDFKPEFPNPDAISF